MSTKHHNTSRVSGSADVAARLEKDVYGRSASVCGLVLESWGTLAGDGNRVTAGTAGLPYIL
ncbi:hypothetical protein DPX16_7007 [Anabarilius grahami]|uniref:Uncharacterized protein n=1 Tax=Anabarilius grahami TaxID=495550 RepID=A0A3N0Z4J3_ANAGA|nr:hypothetical protein DPX16_7007 [Anabarilius grahami]